MFLWILHDNIYKNSYFSLNTTTAVDFVAISAQTSFGTNLLLHISRALFTYSLTHDHNVLVLCRGLSVAVRDVNEAKHYENETKTKEFKTDT